MKFYFRLIFLGHFTSPRYPYHIPITIHRLDPDTTNSAMMLVFFFFFFSLLTVVYVYLYPIIFAIAIVTHAKAT